MSWDQTTAQAFPSTEVTQLHLFRHGRVDTGGHRRAYGHTDYPLTAEGVAQGEALVDFAQRELPRPDVIWSSDLRRCMDIAGPLSEALGVPLISSPLLREQFMGDWEARTWAELTDEDITGVRAYWTDYAGVTPPGGESYRDMATRVEGWLKANWSELRGKRIFVVGHIGPIRALCCRWLGVPLEEALRFTPVYCSHTWFQVAEAGAVLQLLGERTAQVKMGPAAAARREVRASNPLSRPPRLALSGSAGVGKTTLGRALAQRFDVPYLPEGMRARIEGGLSLHDLDHHELQGLVEELWAEQVYAEEQAMVEHGGFVADRSPVDYAAFWLHYHFTHDPAATEAFFNHCLKRASTYDRIVVLPWGVLPLVSDGVRSTNPWLQRGFQALVEGLLFRTPGAPIAATMPDLMGLEERVGWVVDLLEEAGVRARPGS